MKKYIYLLSSIIITISFVSCDKKKIVVIENEEITEAEKSIKETEEIEDEKIEEEKIEEEKAEVKIESDKLSEAEQENEYENLKSLIKEEIYKNFNSIEGEYSVAFKNINESEILSVNNKKMSAASTIKIYIIIEAYSKVKEGKLNLNEVVEINDSMIVDGSGIIQKGEIGDKYTIEELIRLMIIESDNIATNILIDKLGVSNISETIKSIGCTETILNRKMMDEEALENGIDNYTSVNDLVLTLDKLYNGKCIDSFYDNEILNIMKETKSKNKIPSELPKDISIANKSGEKEGVENDVAIVYLNNNPYILCVLTQNGTNEEQIQAISNLSKEIYYKYKIDDNN